MGYDMHVVDTEGRDVDCENNYWRRNMSGGYRQAERLVELGVAYWTADENIPGNWPEAPADAIRSDEGELWDEETGEELDPRYRRIILNHLRQRDSERSGIAAYKLCHSNDGWWVTKEECAAALAIWENVGKPDWDFGLGDLEPFLRAASAHGGFRVR